MAGEGQIGAAAEGVEEGLRAIVGRLMGSAAGLNRQEHLNEIRSQRRGGQDFRFGVFPSRQPGGGKTFQRHQRVSAADARASMDELIRGAHAISAVQRWFIAGCR